MKAERRQKDSLKKTVGYRRVLLMRTADFQRAQQRIAYCQTDFQKRTEGFRKDLPTTIERSQRESWRIAGFRKAPRKRIEGFQTDFVQVDLPQKDFARRPRRRSQTTWYSGTQIGYESGDSGVQRSLHNALVTTRM